MDQYRYHKEDPTNISEESDDKVEEGNDMKISEELDGEVMEWNEMEIEYDTDEEDVIVDKPSKNEDYEEIPSEIGEGII